MVLHAGAVACVATETPNNVLRWGREIVGTPARWVSLW